MMTLPFTRDAFLDVFAAYNQLFWPVALGLWLVTLAALLSVIHRPSATTSRIVALLLAVQWLWVGAVYHAMFFSTINPAAWIFGAMFTLQSLALVWYGVVRNRFRFAIGRDFRGFVAGSFLVYALVYPMVAWASGETFPRLPTFGVPCPTTIVTIGCLLATDRLAPRVTFVIPILWAFIGGSAAFLLNVPADFVLLIAGIALTIAAMASKRETADPTRRLATGAV